MITKLFRPRNLTLLVIMLLLAAVGYGFAAANTVNADSAGDGTGTVSGYTVDVSWDFYTADSDPSDIETVTLNFTAGGTPNDCYINISLLGVYQGWVDAGCDGVTNPVTYTFAPAIDTTQLDAIQVAAK